MIFVTILVQKGFNNYHITNKYTFVTDITSIRIFSSYIFTTKLKKVSTFKKITHTSHT